MLKAVRHDEALTFHLPGRDWYHCQIEGIVYNPLNPNL